MARYWNWLTARGNDRGQGTVEYFLVILAATALAIIALNWMQSGNGEGFLGGLFGNVIDWVVGKF
jgi:hypothetical protein